MPPLLLSVSLLCGYPCCALAEMHDVTAVLHSAAYCLICEFKRFLLFQQAWSNRAQQILVPAWQQVAQVAPPPTTLASDTVAGPQRLADWG